MKTDYKQNPVSQTVWPWLTPQAPVKPQRQKLSTALLPLAVAWTIAGLFFYWSHPGMALFILCFSLFIFLSSQFLPSLFFKIDAAFHAFSRIVGVSITWITLVPFFYLCFTMVRLIYCIGKTDPMTRQFNPESTSYWIDKKETEEMDDYRRQY